MLPALHTTLTLGLGLGLVALAGVCFVLWRRVHALSAIVGRPARAEPVTIAIEPPPAPASVPIAPRVVVPSRPRPAGPRSDFRADAGEVGPTLIAVPNLATAPAPTSGTASDMDRRFGDVWALADAGTPSATIADRTGYPIGQVELILGLRRSLPVAGVASDG